MPQDSVGAEDGENCEYNQGRKDCLHASGERRRGRERRRGGARTASRLNGRRAAGVKFKKMNSYRMFLPRSGEYFTSIKWCNNRSYCDTSFRSASFLNTRKILF